jgi:hypothetical protein
VPAHYGIYRTPESRRRAVEESWRTRPAKA